MGKSTSCVHRTHTKGEESQLLNAGSASSTCLGCVYTPCSWHVCTRTHTHTQKQEFSLKKNLKSSKVSILWPWAVSTQLSSETMTHWSKKQAPGGERGWGAAQGEASPVTEQMQQARLPQAHYSCVSLDQVLGQTAVS